MMRRFAAHWIIGVFIMGLISLVNLMIHAAS